MTAAERPATGATEQLVADAVDALTNAENAGDALTSREMATLLIRSIVPPGSVIADAADRAAIGRALRFGSLCKNIDHLPEDPNHESERNYLYEQCRIALDGLTDADLARLERLSSGEGERDAAREEMGL